MKAFLVGGTNSGSGKTTVTLGLLRAYARRGLRVQPYKVGPDYIDTGWHSAVTGVASRNLDAFMLPHDAIQRIFHHHAAKADLSIIEGVMGLFDGFGVDPLYCSSAGIAKQLDCPIILIVDGKAVSTSAAATVLGFKLFQPDVQIAGVILNRVNTDTHYAMLKQAIEQYCQIPVLGRVPVMNAIALPSRHLGLVTAHEQADLDLQWDQLADVIETHIDLDRLAAIAELSDRAEQTSALIPDSLMGSGVGLTLALAEDEAFNFYYQDNLDLISATGVEIIRFSPLRDAVIPDCDMIYLGGGYPEIHAEILSQNTTMRASILQAHDRGVPIYAECGGLMYLGGSLTTASGDSYSMVGIFPGESKMTGALKRFGYCQATAEQPTLLAKTGDVIRGHEFHYSDFHTDQPTVFRFAKERDGVEMNHWLGGYQVGNTLASYLHVHFLQNPAMLLHWFERARSVQ
jgi:cobyrinic acid a,c-diamide synthase